MDGLKKIGITGAEGFIGKEFSNYLYKKGYKLTLFSYEEIIKDDSIKYIKKDLKDCIPEDFMGIDIIIHLAGTSMNKDALIINPELTDITLKNSIAADIKKFFLISSYAVYGNRDNPARTDSDLKPSDEYSLSKIFSEYFLKKEIINKKISGSIIRICSIYGKEGKGLINILKNKINNSQDIIIDGEFERQYLYVKDLCIILEKILNQDENLLIYNIEGERKNTKEICFLLKENNIKVIFEEKEKESYLCSGIKIETDMNICKFLFEK
ncbi:MAG TPA: NAD-dependent epimerase/dehydratase family protein [Caldisericia bacterium]|nr:NAD-dependent epimerase/dehydratase family protein [Caldisericia bacterium]